MEFLLEHRRYYLNFDVQKMTTNIRSAPYFDKKNIIQLCNYANFHFVKQRNIIAFKECPIIEILCGKEGSTFIAFFYVTLLVAPSNQTSPYPTTARNTHTPVEPSSGPDSSPHPPTTQTDLVW